MDGGAVCERPRNGGGGLKQVAGRSTERGNGRRVRRIKKKWGGNAGNEVELVVAFMFIRHASLPTRICQRGFSVAGCRFRANAF